MSVTVRRSHSSLPAHIVRSVVAAALLFTAVSASAPTGAQAATISKVAICSANLRSSASTTARVRAVIPAKTKVSVVGSVTSGSWRTTCAGKTTTGRSWYRISSINGKTVRSLYGVSYLYSVTTLFKSVPVPVTRYAACGAYLRTSPSPTAPAKGVIQSDTKVLVVATVSGTSWSATCAGRAVAGSGWYRISAVNGQTAQSLYGVAYVYAAAGLFKTSVGTATPVVTPSPTPTRRPDSIRPYDPRSPWNTPIAAGASIDSGSSQFINAISNNSLPLTSDPDQYAIPVYLFDAATPRVSVRMSGYFSSYDAGDASRKGYGFAATITGVPIPSNAMQSAGSDGQIVIWDPASGTEYSFWQFARLADGSYTATNGYRYHTGPGYHGRFADGLAGRGAGTPYFAGLVRKWEIDQKRIDHALAFAYDSPSGQFRYPASKSDGGGFGGVTGTDLPEGARLQLDPTLTDADFDRWGLPTPARTVARALQTYGMYVIDHSGSSKIYLEDRLTAGWGTDINRDLVRAIPWSAFRVVAAPAAP